jgi:outer membrane biosynthesis protein TonB
MKLRLSLTLLILIALTACGSPQPAAPTTAPETQPTTAPPTQPPPTAAPPTNTVAPTATQAAPTEPPPAPTATAAPLPTETATTAPATTRVRPTPTSSGPLTVAIYTANCRSSPTADKPGGVIVQISAEASGGNGRYRYFYQDKESPTKFIEVFGEKGTRLINEVKVTSGDGQEIKKKFDIVIDQLNCP